jgi:2-polyprenyl-3-methyl-5-hydroxy-6-metoxy-1,4-benzoquinol methylase
MRSTSSLNTEFAEFRSCHLRWFDYWFLSNELELLDTEVNTSQVVRIVRDLDRLSRQFKLSKYIVKRIQNHLFQIYQQQHRAPRIIDLCGGYGGFARYLLRWAKKVKLPLEITVLDQSTSMINAAKKEPESDKIIWQVGDATNLNCKDSSFDLALNIQSLHHFEPESIIKFLRESSRIANSVFIFDLKRTPLGFIFVQFLRPFFCRELIHDGLVSYFLFLRVHPT